MSDLTAWIATAAAIPVAALAAWDIVDRLRRRRRKQVKILSKETVKPDEQGEGLSKQKD